MKMLVVMIIKKPNDNDGSSEDEAQVAITAGAGKTAGSEKEIY